MRHAKSDWTTPGLPDRERPLASRGKRATDMLVQYLRREGIAPTLVLCSSAARAVQTLDRIAIALAPETAMSIEEDLYGASCEDLAHRLHQLPDTVPSVMLIGHNPALQRLAVMLTGEGDAQALARLREKLPTGALVTLALTTGEWGQLETSGARLLSLITPKDLSRRPGRNSRPARGEEGS